MAPLIPSHFTVLSESKSESGIQVRVRVFRVRVQVRVLKIRTRVRLEYIAGLEYYITAPVFSYCNLPLCNMDT